MIRQLRSELYALRTTPGPWLTMSAVAALHLFLVAVIGSQGDPGAAWHGLGPSAGELTGYPMLLLGVVAAAQDHRFRTIVPILLTTPGRRRVLAAKAACVAMVATVAASVAQTVWLAAAIRRHGGAAMHTHQPGDLLRLYAVTVGGVVLLSLLGVALGAILRNAATAFAIVPIGAIAEAVAPPARYHGPFTSGLAAFGPRPGPGALFLTGWTVVALAIAVVTVARDVTD
ncbi:hypothetical protein GCM10023196_008480 [Actinoallomurus vinaceus]|uniref:ABC transporter permease n=1 Tax=Actinoallomurus vinaceus TaxID=1080074 RepID=A0ABP8U0U7_9ACTN